MIEPSRQFDTYYHGTTEKAARKIAKKGFNDLAEPANGTSAGHGIYVTRNPGKAAQYGPVVVKVGFDNGHDVHPNPWADEDVHERQTNLRAKVREMGGDDRAVDEIANAHFSDHVHGLGYKAHEDPDDRGTMVIHRAADAHFIGRVPRRGKKP